MQTYGSIVSYLVWYQLLLLFMLHRNLFKISLKSRAKQIWSDPGWYATLLVRCFCSSLSYFLWRSNSKMKYHHLKPTRSIRWSVEKNTNLVEVVAVLFLKVGSLQPINVRLQSTPSSQNFNSMTKSWRSLMMKLTKMILDRRYRMTLKATNVRN